MKFTVFDAVMILGEPHHYKVGVRADDVSYFVSDKLEYQCDKSPVSRLDVVCIFFKDQDRRQIYVTDSIQDVHRALEGAK